MERTGEITAVYGPMLEVTFCRPSDCEKCHACGNGPKTAVIRVKGEGKVGDTAVVSMPTQTVMKASLLAYALPLAGLMIGMIGGSLLFPQQETNAAIIGALIGLGLPLLGVKLTEKRRAASAAWQPKLVEVIPKKANA